MEQIGNNTHINGRLDKIEQTLERLESALLGDKYNGNGYIKKIDNLDQRVEKLEKAQSAQLWFFIGAGGIGGAGIVKLIEYLFH